MARKGSKEVTPRLRFPEFQNAESWSETKLGVIAESESSSLALNRVSVEQDGYALFGADGLVGRIGFFQQSDRYIGIVKDGSGVGRLMLLPAESSVLGTLAYVKPARGTSVSLEWLFHCMSSLSLKKYVKDSGIPHIYFSDYSNETVGLPATAEQQKIADCLTSLGEVIAAQGRKVEALKEHKRGLMQQLFPREGETRPRLRFPEFRNAPEWDCLKLGDFAQVKASGDLDAALFSDTRSGDFVYPVYSNAVDHDGLYGFYSTPFYRDDSVTITARGTLGVALHRDHEFMAIGRLLVVSRMRSVIPRFFAACWNHLAKIPQEVTSIPQLTAVSVRGTVLPIPCVDEQQRIADCLTSLDTRIRAETARLVAFKTHKQGLMQQLFPAPEAAGA